MQDMKMWHRKMQHNFLYTCRGRKCETRHSDSTKNYEYGKPIIHKYTFLSLLTLAVQVAYCSVGVTPVLNHIKTSLPTYDNGSKIG